MLRQITPRNLDDLRHSLEATLTLIERDGSRPNNLAMFNEAQDLIAALPFPTDEYGRATNRLANARRYLTIGERGAAAFELRLLIRSLREPQLRPKVFSRMWTQPLAGMRSP